MNLRSIDEVITYLKQKQPIHDVDNVVLVFHSADEYYDFKNQYYDTFSFFREYYDFGERLSDSIIRGYSPIGINLSYPVRDRSSGWAYCGYDYYKEKGYKVFAIYSEMHSPRERVSIATAQEVDSFLLGD